MQGGSLKTISRLKKKKKQNTENPQNSPQTGLMYEWKKTNLLKSRKPFLEQGSDALPWGSGRGVELPCAGEGACGASSSQLPPAHHTPQHFHTPVPGWPKHVFVQSDHQYEIKPKGLSQFWYLRAWECIWHSEVLRGLCAKLIGRSNYRLPPKSSS